MKKRILWLSLALVAGQASHAYAQGANDALRYSRLQFGGPARTQGIAGANVALGADFGNLTSNPAGLGLFQKSELHLAPGVGIGQSDSRIDGGTGAATNESKNSFHIASAGVVFATRKADTEEGDWRGGALALGFTRQADFNMSTNYQGTFGLEKGSFLERLQPYAGVRNQSYYDALDAQAVANRYTSDLGLAYGAYLANISSYRRAGTQFGKDSAVVLRKQGSQITQGELVTNSGSLSQFDIGYGASYRDRLYIGGAIGFVSSNFNQDRTLTESDNDPNTHFQSLTSSTQLRTKGSGFNARLGVIVRALDNLRLGASVQTPTYMHLSDTYSESLVGTFSANGTDRVPRDLPVGTGPKVSMPTNDYDYTLTTPFRANGGAALTLGKHGFVTGDAEYVGYRQSRLHNDPNAANGDDYTFTNENADVQRLYRNTVNLRFGAEGRFDVFRVRAGYARYGDPYQADTNNERAQNFYTAGLGLRQGNFFLDAAAVYTTFGQSYSPYHVYDAKGTDIAPVIKSTATRYTTTVTAGITF
ncbi:TonB-dependent receptor [Hymenobacter glaciei]|uniref:TonB-dependent receptor n=1 Tax=Hymenobacter glaciei TaxID=877209 RepID=A0ABP7US92_9BACT